MFVWMHTMDSGYDRGESGDREEGVGWEESILAPNT